MERGDCRNEGRVDEFCELEGDKKGLWKRRGCV